MTSTGSRRKFQLLGHPSQLSLNHAASSFHFSLQPQKYLAILAIPHHHFFFARIILLMELTYFYLIYILSSRLTSKVTATVMFFLHSQN